MREKMHGAPASEEEVLGAGRVMELRIKADFGKEDIFLRRESRKLQEI